MVPNHQATDHRERINTLFYLRYIDNHIRKVVLFWKTDSLLTISVSSSWRAWHVPVSVTDWYTLKNHASWDWWKTNVLGELLLVAELQLRGRWVDNCYNFIIAKSHAHLQYSGLYSILILLDLSSAFDTVDHNVLISHLKNYVGISDVALDWFISYLSNRSFSVRLGEASSSCAPLFCGVPQRSILSPLLFNVYMLPLGQFMHWHNIDFHCYADDAQLYVPQQPGKTGVSCIFSCLAEIQNWMSENVLQLNDSKSDISIMSPSGPRTSIINNLSSSLGTLSNNVRKEARNLGVIFDSELSFDTQVTQVVQSCFAQLRQLTKKRFLISMSLFPG